MNKYYTGILFKDSCPLFGCIAFIILTIYRHEKIKHPMTLIGLAQSAEVFTTKNSHRENSQYNFQMFALKAAIKKEYM